MTSNSAQKTFEERLVEKLRDETLMAAIGDEDVMVDLVKRAITDALNREYKDGTHWDAKTTSPIKDAAKKSASELADKVVKAVVESEECQTIIKNAIISMMPTAIFDALTRQVGNSLHATLLGANHMVMDEMRTHLRRVMPGISI